MAQIFISWSSADKEIVLPLANALRTAGYSVDEYSEDPTGGGINENVRRYVDEARLVIFVLSSTSVTKPWIQTEVDWCYYRRTRENLPEVIPLIVGPVPKDSLPHLLQKDPLLRSFPVPAGRLSPDDELKLKDTVRRTLDLPAPIVVPAAFFAMNLVQATALLEAGKLNDVLSALCGKVGMEPFPALTQSLLRRYGKNAEDFAPFPGDTLKQLVQATIGETNLARSLGTDPTPLWIWWCTEALLDPMHHDYNYASNLWNRGPSIAVVDSISILHPDIYKQFTDLPDAREAASSALLWVPPYTLHTAELEALTESSIRQLNRLMGRFRTWGLESGGSYLAFDIGTRPTLRRWIHQAFVHVKSRPAPQASSVAAMRELEQSGFRSAEFFTQQPGN